MGRLTHTVSGSIATVRSPAVAPIESLKVHFSPIQEGTGDPSPSNIRPITGWTGVKLYSGQSDFNYKIFSGTNTNLGVTWVTDSNGKTTATGIPTSWSIKDIYDFDVHGDETIYGRIQGTLNNVTFAAPSLYDSNGQALTDLGLSDAALSVGIDLSQYNDVKKVRIRLKRAYNDIEMNGKSCFIVTSKTNQTNAPIQITFPVVGKNLYDATTYPLTEGKWVHGGSGNVGEVESYAATLEYVPCRNFAGRTITLNKHLSNGAANPGIAFYNQNKQYLSGVKNNNTSGTSTTYNVPSDAYYLRFTVPAGSTNIQLELGSTATAYEPYSSDNTVYGGYVDLATGNIIKEYGIRQITGYESNITWQNYNNQVIYTSDTVLPGIYKDGSSEYIYGFCNLAKQYNGHLSSVSTNNNSDGQGIGFSNLTSVWGAGEISVEAVINMLKSFTDNGNPLTIVYKLATPQLIATLTPQELETFKGYSNFWSNAGDVDVTYQVVESSEMTKERQKIFAGNAPAIHTASGSVANFEMEPGLNRNLKSCKVGFLPVQEGSGDPFPPINQNGSIVGVNNLHNESELSSFKIHFSPIQSGSGDPSPTNIRPITGWTGVTGYKGGKSLLPFLKDSMSTAIDYNGYSGWQSKQYIDKSLKGAKVTYSAYIDATSVASDSGDNCVAIWAQDSNGTYILAGSRGNVIQPGNSGWSKVTLIIPVDTDWITFGLTLKTNGAASNPMVELGTEQTSYEAYSAPTSYPVSWESQGTVYGGYVDLVSGEVVAEYEILSDTWGNFNVLSGDTSDGVTEGRVKRFTSPVYGNEYTNHYTDFCNVAKYAYNNANGHTHYYIVGTSYNCRVYLPIGTDENLQIQVIGKLITPTVVTTLTPQQIALATGKSSYWSNADAVTVETAGNVRPINGWSGITEYACGKNLFKMTSGEYGKWYNANGSKIDALMGFISDSINVNANSIITISYHGEKPYSSSIIEFDSNQEFIKRTHVAWTGENSEKLTITIGSTTKFIKAQISALVEGQSMKTSILESEKIQIEFGSNRTDYESYSENVVPLTFPVQGKNLFDGQYVKGLITGNTSIGYTWNNSGTNANSAIIKCNPNTTYTVKKHSSSNRFSIATCSHYPATNDLLNLIVENSTISQYTCTTGDDAEYLIVYVSTGTEQAEPDLMVEVGSSASAYEPYDNTILGGYVDLVSGEVWKKYGIWDCGDIGWSTTVSNNRKIRYASVNNMVDEAYNISHLYCSSYKFENCTVSDLSGSSSRVSSIIKYSYNGPRVAIRDDTKESLNDSDFKNAVKDIKIIAELATPVLVTTLTPTQIQALKGTNNIFSDANGTIEVKYWSH